MGAAGSNRGGADFRSLLDWVIARERDFGYELRKSGGVKGPFERSPEILKCIFDEADNRRRRLRESIKKEDRCNCLHAPPPSEFPHSRQPEAPPHAMVGKATRSLQQQQQSHHVDDILPSNRNVVVQYHTRPCFRNQNTSNSSMHMPLSDCLLKNHREVERMDKLGYHSYDDPGELPIPPMAKEVGLCPSLLGHSTDERCRFGCGTIVVFLLL